jgi:hypothetical protein
VGASSWIVPDRVTSISLVVVGAGGGGAATNDRDPGAGNGGDLRWRNDVPVTPGQKIWIYVGAGGTAQRSNVKKGQYSGTAGGISQVRFNDEKGASILKAMGGNGGGAGRNQTPNADGSTDINASRKIGGGRGGIGGNGQGPSKATTGGGGGGAGGYTGNGGTGGYYNTKGNPGNGGGGGGGGGGAPYGGAGSGGGGVGLFGRGNNGTAGSVPPNVHVIDGRQYQGGNGSSNLHKLPLRKTFSHGGLYGGGGAGKGEFARGGDSNVVSPEHGGNGAVRIIWGPGRSFPDKAK